MKEHLQAIDNALRAIRLAQLDDQDKNTYIIWKSVEDRNVNNVNDVVGLFHGTYQEADQIIEKLNNADLSVKEGFGGRKLYGYWRSEPTIITNANLKEFTDNL